MIRLAVAAALLSAGPALALQLELPSSARQTVQRNTSPDVYAAPVAVFDGKDVPKMLVEGDVNRTAWRLETPGLTPFQVMRPLRDQLLAGGFDIVLDCDAQRCGGFDFRFALETLPGPNMYVNIRAYHMITAVREIDGAIQDVVTVLTSASERTAYVQIIHAGKVENDVVVIGPSDGAIVPVEPKPQPAPLAPNAGLGAQLAASGRAVLNDLEFDTGSTSLGAGPFASLAQLSEYLAAEPQIRVALVGHTDTVGGLQPNIEISRKRARSVRQRLIANFDVAASRLDAEGMGYLAPVASNLTAAGRDRNRRVEVVLLGLSVE